MTRLPWAALPGKDPGRYLIEDYALATAGSGQQVLEQLSSEGPAGASDLIVGGVAYDEPPPAAEAASVASQTRGAPDASRAWSFLPGTRLEIDRIAQLAPSGEALVVLSRGDANEAAMRRDLPRSTLIHLATHGFFSEPGYRSVLEQPPALDPIEWNWGFMDGAGLPVEPTRSLEISGHNPLLLSGVVLAGANLPPRIDDLGLPEGADGILTGEEVASSTSAGPGSSSSPRARPASERWAGARGFSASSSPSTWPGPGRPSRASGGWTTTPPRP